MRLAEIANLWPPFDAREFAVTPPDIPGVECHVESSRPQYSAEPTRPHYRGPSDRPHYYAEEER